MTGKGLQAWREQFGYTQFELAQGLRVSVDTIIKWEREIRPTLPPYLQTQLRPLEEKKSTESPPAS